MSVVEPLLAELYGRGQAAGWDAGMCRVAARSAPLLLFDAREPFLPLAAGVTMFQQDGPSPSFPRTITLRSEEGPSAALAVEYAIWWDWDIHHLYELEHVWIYLDREGKPVRLEGSWHGKWYAHPLRLEGGRPVLFSEPGKHAFAPDPAWFRDRQREYARADTLAVRAPAGVLVNRMFAGKIRQRVFDRVLARSYLAQQAFAPAWQFTKAYTFPEEALIPWAVLEEWIPRRVNAVLEELETSLPPQAYRALLLARGDDGQASLISAANLGADAVWSRLEYRGGRLMLADRGDGEAVDLEDAFRFLARQPAGLFVEVLDPDVIEPLAWFVRSKEAAEWIAVLSEDPALLSRYSTYVPGGLTAVQLLRPDQDPLEAARAARAAFVAPAWPGAFGPGGVDAAWIRRVHAQGLGVIGGPAENQLALDQLQQSGVDAVLVEREAWKEVVHG